MQSRPGLLAILLVALLPWLGACVAPPTRDRPAEPQPRAEELKRLGDLEARGERVAAAYLAAQLAKRATPPQQYELGLRGADNLIKARRLAEATAVLDGLARAPLGSDQELWLRLMRAEIALDSDRAAQAAELLRQAPSSLAPPALQQRYLRDRAQTFRQTGHLLDSAKARADLDLLLEDSPERLANQQELIRVLTQMTDVSLELLRPEPHAILAGWMDLARVLKATEPGQARDVKLGDWRERHPSHPALAAVLRRPGVVPPPSATEPETAPTGETSPSPADQADGGTLRIGVLLPDSGRFAEAGGVVRDGLLAANAAQPADQRADLRFYDATDPARVKDLVQQAADEGARVVIGPLPKEAVDQLARSDKLAVPVLALNRVSSGARPPEQLYQFSLDPEDEARQVAERAWADGARFALSLTPGGSSATWGDRLREGFRARWENQGGRFAGQHAYDPEQGDLGPVLEQLFELAKDSPGSTALFLVATSPAKAAQIWPQIQARRPANVRVYTTSHAFSGRFDPQKDRDLVGLTFPELPWLVYPNAQDPLAMGKQPKAAGRQGLMLRLFAMGLDSYQLARQLDDLPTGTLEGATGQLSLGPGHQIQRRLLWTRLGAEGPEPVGSTQADAR